MLKGRIPRSLRASYVMEGAFLYPVCVWLTVSLILSALVLSHRAGAVNDDCTKLWSGIRREAYTPIRERTLLTGPAEALSVGTQITTYCTSLASQILRDLEEPFFGAKELSLPEETGFCARDLPYSEALYLRHYRKRKEPLKTDP